MPRAYAVARAITAWSRASMTSPARRAAATARRTAFSMVPSSSVTPLTIYPGGVYDDLVVNLRFWKRVASVRNTSSPMGLDDPRLLSLFGTQETYAGVTVGETGTLSVGAAYRAVALVAGTIAGLPLRALTDGRTGPARSVSFLDAPDGPDGQTPFEWVETAIVHSILHGNLYAQIVRNGAGAVASLPLIHPQYVMPRTPLLGEDRPATGRLWYDVTNPLTGEVTRLDASDIFHVPALSANGLTGLGLVQLAQQGLGLAVAGERAAGRMMSRGALMGGVVSLSPDLTPEEVADARVELRRATSGWENAGGLVAMPGDVRVSPWTMTARDAEMLDSRKFSIEEISRFTGVPPHLLMQTEKQTSWGAGVTEQNRGLSRYTLASWTSRFEHRLTRLLNAGAGRVRRRAEFDYSRLERPNVETDTQLTLAMLAAGVVDVDQAKRRLGLDPSGGSGSAI